MNLVQIENNQPVTSSLQVAEVFEKQHKHVLEAIDDLVGVVENSADLFYEDTYIHPQNKQEYRQIIMDKDGFTLLAMGFTGKKALEFKLKYIEAFNQMETYIKETQVDTTNLSPELQMFNSLFQSLAKQELATKNLESKVDNISEIVALNTVDWRDKSHRLVAKIAQSRGGGVNYQMVRAEIYKETERRAKADLGRRVKNKKQRMALEGVGKSKVNAVNKLDVIGEDSRILEVFMAVVKDFAIQHDISLEV